MISMIIPCYWSTPELWEMTLKCINSLNDTTDTEPQEVLIINDGSPLDCHLKDDTDFVQQFKQIDRQKNGGYASAVNTGLYHATGDIFIICNNDITFPQHDWLDHLLKPLNMGYDISSIVTSDQGWDTRDEITEGDKFGSLWAMKRKVYETVGALDQSFGNYFEDLDFHKRAEDAGFRVAKNHAGIVEHIGKATLKEVDPEDRSYLEAMEKFRKKWGSVW